MPTSTLASRASPRMGEVHAPATASTAALPPLPDEAALVERVRGGDTAAFGTLVQHFLPRAYSVAFRLLGHREDAEDLVQEVFVTALERIETFQPGRPFGPWFFRILVNRGLNARKARSFRYTEAVPLDTRVRGVLPDRAAEQAEVRDRLRQALQTLSEQQRTVVTLYELEGFTGAEIAAIMEIPAGTVRWHLHEARRKLREALPHLRREP